MPRRILTELEIEEKKWPAPPGDKADIEVATAIAGKCWRIIISHSKGVNAINVDADTIYVTPHRLPWSLPKLIAVAHKITCLERTSSGTTEAGQLFIRQLADDVYKTLLRRWDERHDLV